MNKNKSDLGGSNTDIYSKLKLYAIYIAVLIALIMAFVNGFRLPNLWSTDYYQFSYFDGFFRRAFLGTLFYPFGCARFNYWNIALLDFLTLFLAIFLLIWQGVKAGLGWFVVMFFVSAAGGYLFHVVGYPEFILYLLCLIGLKLIINKKYGYASFIVLISLLVHEMALLTTIPVMFLAMVFLDKKISIKTMAIVFSPMLIILLVQLLFFQTVPHATILSYLNERAACGYPMVRTDFTSVFTHNFSSRMGFYYTPGQMMYNIPFILIFGFSIAFFIAKNLKKWWIGGFVFLGTISPLILGVAGWDTDRWIFLSFVNCIVVMILYAKIEKTNQVKIADSKLLLTTCLLVMLTLQLVYFDGFVPRGINQQGIHALKDYMENDLEHKPGL